MGDTVLDIPWVGPLILSVNEVCRVPVGVAGVYLLHGFIATLGRYPVLYVGRSSNLRRRIMQHVDHAPRIKPLMRALRAGMRMYFSAAPVPNRELRDRIESGLIRGLRPPGNQQIPVAAPVLVRLPPIAVWH